MSNTKNCRECGAEMTKSPHYSWAQWGSRVYCSRKCSTAGTIKDGKRFLFENGHLVSTSVRKKIGLRLMRNRNGEGNIGRKLSPEHRAVAIRNLNRGVPWNKGRRFPQVSGKNHYRWIEDRTKLSRTSNQGERRTSAYTYWRHEVWSRDEFQCLIANADCGGRLEAHHILGWKDYPELRYEIKNGITLCHFHHPRKRKDEARLSPYFNELLNKKQYGV